MEIQREPNRKPRPEHPHKNKIQYDSDWTPRQDLSFLGGSRKRKGRKLIEFQFLSALVDGLVILGVSLLLCSLVLTFFNSQISKNLFVSTAKLQFIELFAIVFCWFQFCYLIILRSYLGYTLGEKTFNIRLGVYQERFLLSYPFRVIFRTVIILGTGIVVLPLLSWLFEKDLAGEITHLKIVSLV